MYAGSIVFDGHMDTPLRMLDDGVDLGVRREAGHADLPRLAEGGVDAVFLAAWIDPALADGRARAAPDPAPIVRGRRSRAAPASRRTPGDHRPRDAATMPPTTGPPLP